MDNNKVKRDWRGEELQFFSEQNTHVIVCPVCGFDYNHFDSPEEDDGEDGYQADWEGRGDLIKIPFWCECGSRWELCLGFHKGNTHSFARIIESCEEKGFLTEV